MKTMLRDLSTLLVVVLLAMTVASCGNDALRQCEEELSGVEEKNQELQEALRQSHIESQKVKDALAHAQADNERLREELSRGDAVGRTEPDLA
jgi:septal ring factor EnvC (AmiA/AmiB activator)